MSGDILEARDLRGLRRQVGDGVEHEIGDRERSGDSRGREVSDRDADVVAADLATFAECTGGRTDPPAGGSREAWLIVGRRGGKSVILSAIAVATE